MESGTGRESSADGAGGQGGRGAIGDDDDAPVVTGAPPDGTAETGAAADSVGVEVKSDVSDLVESEAAAVAEGQQADDDVDADERTDITVDLSEGLGTGSPAAVRDAIRGKTAPLVAEAVGARASSLHAGAGVSVSAAAAVKTGPVVSGEIAGDVALKPIVGGVTSGIPAGGGTVMVPVPTSAGAAAPVAGAGAGAVHLRHPPPPPVSVWDRILWVLMKMRGLGDRRPPRDHGHHIAISALGAFLAIFSLSVLNFYATSPVNLSMLMMSFGASAVLLYGVPKSPLSQPRNFLGSHLIAAVVGLVCRNLFELIRVGSGTDVTWLALPISMALSLALFQLTLTTHPPGGATALIAASQPTFTQPGYGFLFLLLPVLSGSLIMLIIALLVNNIPQTRHYPTHWW